MQIDIREVVATYVLDVSGQKVNARITKDIGESMDFEWDISHHQGGHTKSGKPSMLPVGSQKEAFEQIIAYAQGFDPQYSPVPNNSY